MLDQIGDRDRDEDQRRRQWASRSSTSRRRRRRTVNASRSGPAARRSRVPRCRSSTASSANAAAVLRLGLANGGIETDAVAPASGPWQTGTVGRARHEHADHGRRRDHDRGAARRGYRDGRWRPPVPIWGTTANVSAAADRRSTRSRPSSAPRWPTRLPASASRSRRSRGAATARTLTGAVRRSGSGSLRILPGPGDPNVSFRRQGRHHDTTTATAARLTDDRRSGSATSRATRPARGLTALGAAGGRRPRQQRHGADAPPSSPATSCRRPASTRSRTSTSSTCWSCPTRRPGTGMTTVLTEAIAYCTRRRAFMIIDAPEQRGDVRAGAGVDRRSDASPLRSRNVGALLPAAARSPIR